MVRLAADKENIPAIVCLGNCYQKGLGTEKSLKKAIYYFQLAADLGSVAAWGYLADIYKNSSDIYRSEEKAKFYSQKRFNYYRDKADESDSDAQVIVGRLFEKGQGVEQSFESAIHYYQLAACQNNARGLFYLAECFAEGKGVNQSSDKAIFYYKQAADLNDTLSQFVLATYLLTNKIAEEQGVNYLKLIVQAKQSDVHLMASCEYELGNCFEKGAGVKQSNQNAIYYYDLAAQHGNEFAQIRLGEVYLDGKLGVKKSSEKAIAFYLLAANQENYSACEILAQCYEKGIGVDSSPEKSLFYKQKLLEYYKKEAECGDPYFQVTLGQLFEKGDEIPRSFQNAVYYYQLAANANDPRGLFYL